MKLWTPVLRRGYLILLLGAAMAGSAQTTTFTTNFSVGAGVPDGSPVGFASFQTITTPITYVTGLKVTLKITGTYNGDLYCYLANDSGFTVLLNRPGRRASSGFGYSDSGVNVTFDDAAADGDAHIYRRTLNGSDTIPLAGALTGTWAPDGRTNGPNVVLDTDVPHALLDSFTGADPNGNWVLFVADLATGDIQTLDNWGLIITGYTPPTITAQPADQSVDCSGGTANFNVVASGIGTLSYQWRSGGAPILGATSSSYSLSNPTFANAGGYDVIVSSTISGSTTSAVATLTITDTTPPSITCAPAKTVECGSGWSFDAPSASDACSSATVTVLNTTTNTTGHCGNTFDATRTWRATDASGHHADCSQTVTVQDHTAPTIACAGAKMVECGTAWTFDLPTASDACGSATVSILSTTTNTTGHCGNTFDATRTWRATDGCGNTADCSQTVTAQDTTAPLIACVANKTVECTSTWSFDAPTASDACGSATVSILSTTTNTTGHCGNTLDATRTWRATDSCGNTADCSQTVTVQDTTAPLIACVANKTAECTSTWSFDAPTASDTCGGATIAILSTTTNTTGHCGNTFDATRTWRATDSCGNTADCSQTVTGQDHTAPTIVCSGPKTVECGTAWTFDAPTASDTCGSAAVSILSTTTNTTGHCGNTFDAIRTWRATDACGNTADCSQTVTAEDHTAPTIACAANKTVECTSSWTFDPPTASDTCGSATVSILSTTTNTTGHCGNTFDATRTWRATDGCGNTADCSQTVTVEDHTAPAIVCVANKTVECTSLWNFDAPTASDTCGGATIALLSTTTNTTGHCGTTFDATRTWRATDSCGNTADCSQTVTVQDHTAPTIVCSGARTVECGSAWSFDAPTASDTCGSATIAIVSTTTNTTGHCGNTFDATRTWRATDACGNTADCSQTVTVEDHTAPTLSCVAGKTVECGSSWTFDTPTASDICGSATVSILSTTTNTTGHCGNTFDATRTWRATDSCGNTADCSQTVTVEDHTAPTLTCVGGKTVECTSSWTFDAPTASDTCGNATVSILSTTTNTTGHCGNTFDATRTWRATDSCGNAADCSQTVTVEDHTAPTLTCVGGKTVECTSSWTFDAPTASDTCGSATVSILSTATNTTGHCGNTFDATRTWRATDSCGNTTDCSQTVTVQDHTAPSIVCVAGKTVECGSAWTFDAPTAGDTCGTATVVVFSTSTNTPGHLGNAFDATRTWRATDSCGNTADCSQTVTVVDSTVPAITCSANISLLTTNPAGTAVTFVVSATDVCSGAVTPVCSPASGSVFVIGATPVNCTATDPSHNSSACSFSVTLTLNHAPVAGDNIMGAMANHSRSITVEKLLSNDSDSDGDPLAITAVSASSTNGGTVTLSSTQVTYTPAANYVGADLFTYTVSDGRGGIATASVLVQVISANDPSHNRLCCLVVTPSSVTMQFAGIPGFSYTVQRSTDLSTWSDIGSFTVPDEGIATFVDTHPAAGPAFYRTLAPE